MNWGILTVNSRLGFKSYNPRQNSWGTKQANLVLPSPTYNVNNQVNFTLCNKKKRPRHFLTLIAGGGGGEGGGGIRHTTQVSQLFLFGIVAGLNPKPCPPLTAFLLGGSPNTSAVFCD